MLNDYHQRFYNKLYERTRNMRVDEFEMSKKISSWKKRIGYGWNNINVIEASVFENQSETCKMGQVYSGRVVLDLNELSPSDIGVELVLTENGERIIAVHEFKLVKTEVDKSYYETKLCINQPGTFNYGIRIFPKNEFLPHRQDMGLVRWI